MDRRRFIHATLGLACLPAAARSVDVATISVDGRRVATMQDAADAGGTIVLSRGRLPAVRDGRAVAAAHFRKPVTVVADGTIIENAAIEGKGTFIVDANASFSGFDISGAAGDGIGAAFRHQGGDLVIRRTRIHGCENGLLGPARYVDCSLSVDDCDVYDNGTGTGQTHGLYVGAIASFTCVRSRFRATSIGHHIKSRARRTSVRDCEVGTDFAGDESYNVDVPQGGDVVIASCRMRQGPKTDNDAMVNVGGERDPYPGGSLTVTGTKFASTAGGTGIRIHANVDIVALVEDCDFDGLAVPVEGACVLRNCRRDGKPLPDARLPRAGR
jgi:hypothetical protein